MATCSICSYDNPDDAIACENCGAILEGNDVEIRPGTHPLSEVELESEPEPVQVGLGKFTDKTMLLLDFGAGEHETYTVEDGHEIVIGRGKNSMLDLTLLSGQTTGVSRSHAVIRRIGNRLFIIDLDSTNGTYLNHFRIAPNSPEPLRDGDLLRLGLFEMAVRFINRQ